MSTRASVADCQKPWVPSSAPTASQPAIRPASASASVKVAITITQAASADGNRIVASDGPKWCAAAAAIQ
jgi:hypothetical protein